MGASPGTEISSGGAGGTWIGTPAAPNTDPKMSVTDMQMQI